MVRYSVLGALIVSSRVRAGTAGLDQTSGSASLECRSMLKVGILPSPIYPFQFLTKSVLTTGNWSNYLLFWQTFVKILL